MKRFLSVFLSVCLVITMLVTGIVTVSAEGNPIDSTNITWSFNAETGELRFDGEGAIPDYDNYRNDSGQLALEYPWKDCDYTSIVFGEGITGIGNYAFCYSENLKSVEIPDTVTVLGKGIFFGCTSLETVKMPSEVVEVSENMFSLCMNLKTVTLGAKTESIAAKAFHRCSALETITLPETLKSIGNSAFEMCTSLKSVAVPEGVTTIGERVFFACEALKEITLPSTLETIGESTFNECIALEAIVIPEKITTIPSELFYNCRALTNITLPEGLVEIQNEAFYLCTSLTSITVPASVNIIGSKALGYGRLGRPVEGFVITGYANTNARLYADANDFEFVSLGYVLSGKCGETSTWEYNEEEKTLYIGGSGAMEDFSSEPPALYNLIDYEKVVIGEEITRIGAYAFYGAPAMDFALSTSVTEIGEKAIGYYVDENGEEVLREGTSITAYEDTVAHAYAVENSITFNSLGKLLVTNGFCGDEAGWTYDEETKTLTISGVGAIYDYTAEILPEYAEYEIDSVVVPDGITAIGDYAFCTTNTYNSITIGKDVFSIGENAFGFTKEFLTDEEGNPTEEVVFIPNNELVVTGYIVTPADEYSREFEFIFEALDGDIYPEFSFRLPSVIDHINNFVILYANETSAEDLMSTFPTDSFETVVAPEAVATGAELSLTNANGTYDYKLIVIGDVNSDGESNSTDALSVLRHSVQMAVIEDACRLKASDINHDGNINSTDALIILQLTVGNAHITDYYNPGKIR